MKSGDEIIEIIDRNFTSAVKSGISHLTTEDVSLNGRTIRIKGKDLINFGSCSYLGLEKDPRLINGVISYQLLKVTLLKSLTGLIKRITSFD